jgi:hypothetical protein
MRFSMPLLPTGAIHVTKHVVDPAHASNAVTATSYLVHMLYALKFSVKCQQCAFCAA